MKLDKLHFLAKAIILAVFSTCTLYSINAQTVQYVTSTSTNVSATQSIEALNYIEMLPGFSATATSTSNFSFSIRALTNCFSAPTEDKTKNWSRETNYDLDGNIVSDAIVYSDYFGRPIQSQSKNIQENKIFVSETIYDNLGRAALSTMPAPSMFCDFAYLSNFTQNASGQKYSVNDFDKPVTSTTSPAAGEVYNPVAVGNNDGTTGWYYSLLNSIEPNTPITSYPYSRIFSIYPEVVSQSGPSLVTNFKTGSQMVSATLPVQYELDHYASKSTFYAPNARTLQVSLVDMGFTKSISKNADGVEKVGFFDPEGKIVASADVDKTSNIRNDYNLGRIIKITTKKSTPPSSPDQIAYSYTESQTCPLIKITPSSNLNQKITVNVLGPGAWSDQSYNNTPHVVKNYSSIAEFNSKAGDEIFKIFFNTFIITTYNVEIISYEEPLELILPSGALSTSAPCTNCIYKTASAPTGISGYKLSIRKDNNQSLADAINYQGSTYKDLEFIPSQTTPPQKFRILTYYNESNYPLNYFENLFPANNCTGNTIIENGCEVSDNTCYLNPTNATKRMTPISLNANFTTSYGDIRVESKLPFSIKYKNSSTQTLTETSLGFSSDFKALSKPNTYLDIHLTEFNNNTLRVSCNSTIRIINLQTGHLVYSGNSGLVNLGILKSGFYRIMGSNNEQVGIRYYTSYTNFSYYYYNDANQLIATVAPNDTKPGSEVARATTYKYNSLGQVLRTSSTDEGLSEFVYRKDGQIRFSKNAKQQALANGTVNIGGTNYSKTFAYTNYDRFGRSLESGEYQGTTSTGLHYVFQPEDATKATATATYRSALDIVESINTSPVLDNLDVARCNEKTFATITNTETSTSILTRGATAYIPRNVAGGIVSTKNDNTQTWYSYDVNGRMEWTVQNINGLGFKSIDYTYDDKNGNLLQTAYQKGEPDQFYHHYSYDKNQQLIKVETSLNGTTKQEEVEYKYSVDGALKRTELANDLQGIDYLYTIDGQLKSLNHFGLDNINDPGKDGYAGSTFAKDVFGLTFNYYDNDYASKNYNATTLNTFVNFGLASFPTTAYKKTNANGLPYAIAWRNVNNTETKPMVYNYDYDDRYLLRNAKYGTLAGNVYTESVGSFNETGITYDANGNMGSLTRGTTNYTYNPVSTGSNKLSSVSNYVSTYNYSEIGEINKFVKGTVTTNLDYNAYGNMRKYTPTQASPTNFTQYSYSDDGNRCAKETYSANVLTGTYYYVYDAAGNVVSMYSKTSAGVITQEEIPVYGMGRIAVASQRTGVSTRTLDYYYEIQDHLGNTRARLARNKVSGAASILFSSDYYPYGTAFNQITGISTRYTYQGQFAEKDNESGLHHFDLRDYDPTIGRWLSADPYAQYHSPYVGMGNSPVMGVDADGGRFSPVGAVVGGIIGFGVGASFGMAVDKDNWGYYAAGGAVAGALIGGFAGGSKYDGTGHVTAGQNSATAGQKLRAAFGEGKITDFGQYLYNNGGSSTFNATFSFTGDLSIRGSSLINGYSLYSFSGHGRKKTDGKINGKVLDVNGRINVPQGTDDQTRTLIGKTIKDYYKSVLEINDYGTQFSVYVHPVNNSNSNSLTSMLSNNRVSESLLISRVNIKLNIVHRNLSKGRLNRLKNFYSKQGFTLN